MSVSNRPTGRVLFPIRMTGPLGPNSRPATPAFAGHSSPSYQEVGRRLTGGGAAPDWSRRLGRGHRGGRPPAHFTQVALDREETRTARVEELRQQAGELCVDLLSGHVKIRHTYSTLGIWRRRWRARGLPRRNRFAECRCTGRNSVRMIVVGSRALMSSALDRSRRRNEAGPAQSRIEQIEMSSSYDSEATTRVARAERSRECSPPVHIGGF